jgi:diaminopimelate decarboxylase
VQHIFESDPHPLYLALYFQTMDFSDGTYKIQGIAVTELAQDFGTPLYVYDGEKIIQQIQRLRNAFSGSPLRIKYAAKALTNISILKLIRRAGAEIEVVSPQEAGLALKAGFLPGEITFTPSGVDFAEIEHAVESGFSVNIDNLSSLEKFGRKYGSSWGCGLRINPHIMAGGNLKISTGHSNSKFGISIEQRHQILEIVNRYHIPVNGLHIHTGSDITDSNVFLQMADVLFETAGMFENLKFIDFGSGFKVAYKEGDKVTDIEDLGKKLTHAFNNFCTRYGKQLELWIEPGKFVVSEAGILLVRVNVVKRAPAITFVGVNSGLNHLIRPMMYDAYHHIVNISNPNGPEQTYTIVGYICETDTFAAGRQLQEVREDDILAVKNAGAYGFSMASNYNSRLKPAEVLIVNAEAHLIRERETFDDLLNHQIVADF